MNQRNGLREATTRGEDEELIVLLDMIARGDECALRALHDRIYPRLFASALQIVRRRDAAEDVVQETLVSVWRVSMQYRPSMSPPMAWLFMIVRSRVLEALRKRSTSREPLTDGFDELQPSWDVSQASDPADLVSSRQQVAALRDMLVHLGAISVFVHFVALSSKLPNEINAFQAPWF